MELVNQNQQTGGFGARGVCPRCSIPSLHILVAGPFIKPAEGQAQPESNVLVQCQNCRAVMYVVGKRHAHASIYEYKESFPLEDAEASVDKQIPEGVRDDFVEAFKCRSVDAYKATVVMCRRALQASCQQFKVEGKKLIDQIDDLATKGRITGALRQMAHDIRKLGNDGAHPDEDGLGDVIQGDAEDIIEFTRQYFEHVYVMPAKSEAFRKRREAATAQSANAVAAPKS
jgi:Domain of unknown function (DUF4145)